MGLFAEKTIYIVPMADHTQEMFLNRNSRDNSNKCFCDLVDALKTKGYLVVISDLESISYEPYAVLVFNVPIDDVIMNRIAAIDRKKCMLFLLEPPAVYPRNYEPRLKDYFGHIFTLFDDQVDNETYFKFFYPQPYLTIKKPVKKFSKKKLCTLVNSAKSSDHVDQIYSERKLVIEFFEKLNTKDFCFAGFGWKKNEYRNYIGQISNKTAYLKDFKFCFTYENMKGTQGYITEKIFDCFHAGCVPIYWGADTITDYIPEGCFIDRRKFSSIHEVYYYIKDMKEKEYKQYLKNIDQFLKSDRAQAFSITRFIQIIFKALDGLNA